jgi:TorA maturation chaperone TorD
LAAEKYRIAANVIPIDFGAIIPSNKKINGSFLEEISLQIIRLSSLAVAITPKPLERAVMIDDRGGQVSQSEGDEEFLRARFYALLSTLLSRPPDAETLTMIRSLEGNDSPMGKALGTLAQAAADTSLEELEEEFTKLFYGVGAGGELLPYASHYMTGLLYDKPLADLRSDLKRLGLEGNPEATEPEDCVATELEIMHTLILGYRGPDGEACQQSFFKTHLLPWASNFFTDLEKAENASVYVPVGTIGLLLMEIEEQAFEMAA